MPRLPAPSITLKAHEGRLLEPAPTSRHLQGIRPVSYAPIAQRLPRQADVLGKGAAIPAGWVDAAHLAGHLGVPEALIVYRAAHRPSSVPPHVLVDGRPYFSPVTLTGVHP